jgi:hypothetical protein
MEESWISLRMKMRDMPYYEYNKEGDNDEPDAKEGTLDDLRRIAGKCEIK